ncbi:hypothetical protein F4824DRAFT_473549 [Ustulina deusta]|nr:hypothetical protein F4824DRAFT_473549 [Ustulina deusta]
MLPRQLHRPLLRSVTAAWRPATASPAPFHHGHSRSNSTAAAATTTSEKQQEGDALQQQEGDAIQQKEGDATQQQEVDATKQQEVDAAKPKVSSPAPTRQKPSLLELLFPDEARRVDRAKARSATDSDVFKNWASHLFDDDNNGEPPRLAVPEELQDDEENGMPAHDEAPGFYSPALRAKSMLILSAASKSLRESDFLRLGMKGKHVEGWVGGILKVIQARNPDTLEPKGHYFILFDTDEAAAAYKDRLEQLWQLGKAHVPGAHHGLAHMRQQPLPRGLRRTEHGEDVAQLIRTFTLVPPSQRLHLQQSRLGRARVAELYREGGFVDRLAARAGSGFLVLVRLDGGRLALETLRRAIDEDGARRHLAWRVADLDRGILPFGKSILKASDRAPAGPGAGGLSDQGGSARDVENEGGDEHSSGTTRQGMAAAICEAEESEERARQYPRFIIPFMDEAEAYRFVQNWHRRELKLRMTSGVGKNAPSWEETRIINATILW